MLPQQGVASTCIVVCSLVLWVWVSLNDRVRKKRTLKKGKTDSKLLQSWTCAQNCWSPFGTLSLLWMWRKVGRCPSLSSRWDTRLLLDCWTLGCRDRTTGFRASRSFHIIKMIENFSLTPPWGKHKEKPFDEMQPQKCFNLALFLG